MARDTIEGRTGQVAERHSVPGEARFDDFFRAEAEARPAGGGAAATEPVTAPAPAETVTSEVRRLVQASIDASERRTRSRLDAMEERLLRATSHVAEGRNHQVATDHRLSALEARITALEALPSVVEDLVTAHVDRLGAQIAGLPADVEGVYRELDAVAEVMTARTATIGRGLDRLGPLESAVLELRQQVRQAQAAAEAARATNVVAHGDRIETLERRLEAMERPGAELERLHKALGEAVAGAEPDGFGSASRFPGDVPGAPAPRAAAFATPLRDL